MGERLKNIVVSAFFVVVIFGLMLANIFVPDQAVSRAERRKLNQIPAFSVDKLLNGKLLEEYEKYFLDQFVLRDQFRAVKAVGQLFLLRLWDNNGIYLIGDEIYKTEYPLNTLSVQRAAEKFNQIRALFLQDMNVYYAIIPDKNYFVAKENGYPSIDYARMTSVMAQYIEDMTYIDLFDTLKKEDYFRTDLHWRQDRILGVSDRILSAMLGASRPKQPEYTTRHLSPFYGAYYGQAALPISPDELIYLTNGVIEGASVYNPVTGITTGVYQPDRFEEIDPYNIFLQGPEAIVVINNPACPSGRELYLFRDSFSSSLAPLMLEGYSKITMIDLRYVAPTLIENYVDFNPGSDALFIYGTQVLNQSAMLK